MSLGLTGLTIRWSHRDGERSAGGHSRSAVDKARVLLQNLRKELSVYPHGSLVQGFPRLPPGSMKSLKRVLSAVGTAGFFLGTRAEGKGFTVLSRSEQRATECASIEASKITNCLFINNLRVQKSL